LDIKTSYASLQNIYLLSVTTMHSLAIPRHGSIYSQSILFRCLGSDLSIYSRCDLHSALCLSNHCCIWLVLLTHNLWGFCNEGLLSVPQIKHMTYATMLPSYCLYCLSLYLLSLTYFFLH
jgi:hypothetical protein